MQLLRILKKPGDLRKLAVTHGIGERPGNVGTWMEQPLGEAGVHSNRAGAHMQRGRAVQIDYGSSTNGFDIRLRTDALPR